MSTEFLSVEAAREGAKWWVIDAAGMPVGRLATEAANLLRGKNKPTYTPNVDSGDFVVVVNAEKVRLTDTTPDSSDTSRKLLEQTCSRELQRGPFSWLFVEC